ncbi:MAG: DUF1559 domain-containing protein [Gemmata sp.]|nr:DUF1559 domain-containing protein [Gemmata sp.]
MHKRHRAGLLTGVILSVISGAGGRGLHADDKQDLVTSVNNLKHIGLAIHSFYDANGRLPMDITDKNGKPILSWRVEILPYLEQDQLFRQFRLDEPWDSENNKKVSQTMVKIFLAPDAQRPEQSEWGWTSYRGIAGPGASFEAGKKLKFTDFEDGLSNTILVIESKELIPWAKPGDYPFDPNKPLPKISPVGTREEFLALFADGAVRSFKPTINEKKLKALLTRSGGETITDCDF